MTTLESLWLRKYRSVQLKKAKALEQNENSQHKTLKSVTPLEKTEREPFHGATFKLLNSPIQTCSIKKSNRFQRHGTIASFPDKKKCYSHACSINVLG